MSLTACTYALSPQVPQHRKVIGGGRRIGQLWKHRERQGVSEVIRKSARVQLGKKNNNNNTFDSSLNSAELNILSNTFQ